MPAISRAYFSTAILFLLVGIGLGLMMAITHDHSAMPAHAHVNLLGWVTSALFGVYFALNPGKAVTKRAWIQFCSYTLGLIIMLPSLYFMILGNAALEPVVAIGSMLTAAAILLFAVILFMPDPRMTARPGTAAVPAE